MPQGKKGQRAEGREKETRSITEGTVSILYAVVRKVSLMCDK